MALRDEILEQPAVLQGWLDTQLGTARTIAKAIRQRKVDYVLLAGRGTSDHAGIYAQYVWGTRNRLPVALAAPSLFTMYKAAPRVETALAVGISQSGQSPDIVAVLQEAARQGAPTLALTNDPDSPLARAAEWTLPVSAGPERAVAATKTYTAELLALAALSVLLAGADAEDLAALRAVPGAVTTALRLEDAVATMAARHRDRDRAVVLGRGYHYATAQEWALKLKELTYTLADAYSPADFQHGPIALLEPGFPVLAVAPSGAVFADMLDLLRRLRTQYQADLLVLSDHLDALAQTPAALKLPSGVPEWLMPLVSIVPAQLYCYHLARAKGLDPENPRTLNKVTRTH
jgi:glucosamine--fructose-6-phosphate aminotransferase (isomerizing)